MPTFTCSKIYKDIPFAHRHHTHTGHCHFIHGHNWTLTLNFEANTLDNNHFVIDFGELHMIKDWLQTHLDHACVLSQDDPLKDQLMHTFPEIFKFYIVPNCSCEGLAKYLYGVLNPLVQSTTQNRVHIHSLTLAENFQNSVTYHP